MSTQRKTKLEIIEETVNFYTNNPERRGYILDDNWDNREVWCCIYGEYSDGSGRVCAVGRCFDPQNPHVVWEYRGDVVGYETHINKLNQSLDSHFKEEYRGHEVGFWMDLQRLHDDNYIGDEKYPGREFWVKKKNERGEIIDLSLSEVGKNYVEALKNKYSKS